MQYKQLIATCALVLAAAVPAFCQGSGLEEILSGKSTPAAVKLKSLDGTWRRMTLAGPADASGNNPGQMAGGILGPLMGLFGGGGAPMAGPPPYYTQGKTVTIGGETFLVTYHPSTKGVGFGDLMKAGQGAPLPDPEKLTAESEIPLQLVNVRSIISISDIRAFNLEEELADAAKAAAAGAAFLKQMQQGMGMFGGGAAPAPAPAAPKKPAAKPKPGI